MAVAWNGMREVLVYFYFVCIRLKGPTRASGWSVSRPNFELSAFWIQNSGATSLPGPFDFMQEMEAVCASVSLVPALQTTQSHNQEDHSINVNAQFFYVILPCFCSYAVTVVRHPVGTSLYSSEREVRSSKPNSTCRVPPILPPSIPLPWWRSYHGWTFYSPA
jgi:hypothetical protein